MRRRLKREVDPSFAASLPIVKSSASAGFPRQLTLERSEQWRKGRKGEWSGCCTAETSLLVRTRVPTLTIPFSGRRLH